MLPSGFDLAGSGGQEEQQQPQPQQQLSADGDGGLLLGRLDDAAWWAGTAARRVRFSLYLRGRRSEYPRR